MTSQTKTAFVTGGTGFLGRNLVDVLLGEGWSVTCLHRASSNVAPLAKLGVSLVVADMTDTAALTAVIPEGVDAVFHVAANTSMWRKKNAEQTRDNVDATRAVVDAALAAKAKRFALTSSIAAFALGEGDLDESTPQRGERAWINYERTKYLAEQVVVAAASRGLDAVILNPAHIVGRYDTHNWCQMISMVDKGTLPGIPPGSGPFGSAREIAKAHVRAIERGGAGERFLLGGVHASFAELIATIGDVLGKKPKAPALPAFALKALGAVKGLVGDLRGVEPALTPEKAAIVCQKLRIVSTKAHDRLGYEAIPLRTMLAECVEWMRAEGTLPSEHAPKALEAR